MKLLRLFIAMAALAAVWLIALPQLAHEPYTRGRIELLESKNVNPVALRYTELHEFPAVLDRLEQRLGKQPDVLWSPR